MKTLRDGFLAAVTFLTRVPVGPWYRYHPDSAARASAFFPAVGLLVGAAGAAVYAGAAGLFPVPAAVLVSMLATVVVTGGFHEDGLADAADGLGGFDAARRLEIMKDSRLGTFGSLALWFSLTGKWACLDALALRGGTAAVAAALLAAHTLGRGGVVAVLAVVPYLLAPGAKSQPFCLPPRRGRLAAALLLPAAAPLVLLRVPGLGAGAAGRCLLAAAAAALACGWWFRRQFGGVTGDCLGATNQVVELACYLALAARG